MAVGVGTTLMVVAEDVPMPQAFFPETVSCPDKAVAENCSTMVLAVLPLTTVAPEGGSVHVYDVAFVMAGTV